MFLRVQQGVLDTPKIANLELYDMHISTPRICSETLIRLRVTEYGTGVSYGTSESRAMNTVVQMGGRTLPTERWNSRPWNRSIF
jgi:hypothetical protein